MDAKLDKNAQLILPACWAKPRWIFTAPNGRQAWENLQHWLGGSQVVQPDGAPLRVFHGTNQTFTKFDTARLGTNTTAASSIAFFFSECPYEAAEYANLAGRGQVGDAVEHERQNQSYQQRVGLAEKRGDWDLYERLMCEWETHESDAINADPTGMQILPVFLHIERPLIVDMQHRFDGHFVAKQIINAKTQGFDGLKLVNVWDAVDAERINQDSTTQWVVFEPHQIISATGDCGNFEPQTPEEDSQEVDDNYISYARAKPL